MDDFAQHSAGLECLRAVGPAIRGSVGWGWEFYPTLVSRTGGFPWSLWGFPFVDVPDICDLFLSVDFFFFHIKVKVSAFCYSVLRAAAVQMRPLLCC